MAHADQLQPVVIHAKDLVVVEVDAVDVRFDHVIAHHLAKAQQAVFFAQGQQVFEQARPMVRGKLTHQHASVLSMSSWVTTPMALLNSSGFTTGFPIPSAPSRGVAK